MTTVSERTKDLPDAMSSRSFLLRSGLIVPRGSVEEPLIFLNPTLCPFNGKYDENKIKGSYD